MNFDYIKNSIEINETQEPSVFLALCLMEMILKDVKMESDTDLADLQVGDDTWPLKMSLIYRNLKTMYDANRNDVVRGRKQIEDKLEEAKKIEEELEKNRSTIEEVNALEKKLEEKRRILESTNHKKSDLLDQLSSSDKRIETLNHEISDIEDASSDIEGTIRKLQTDKETLTADLVDLKRKSEDSEKYVLNLRSEVDELKERYTSLVSQTEDLRNEKEKYNGLLKEFESLDVEAVKGKIDRYRSQTRVLKAYGEDLLDALRAINSITGKRLAGEEVLGESIKSINDMEVVIGRLRESISKVSNHIRTEGFEK